MDRAKRGKSNKTRRTCAPSGSSYRRGRPLQLSRPPSTIGGMLSTKVAMLIAGAGAALAVSLLPLLSLNGGVIAGPPYTLDEAVQLVQQQTQGTIIRAETVTGNTGVTPRGIPSADTEDDGCPCAEKNTDDPTENQTDDERPDNEAEQPSDISAVTPRGVPPAPPTTIHHIRILRPDGVVSTILVDEQLGIIVPESTAEPEPAPEKN